MRQALPIRFAALMALSGLIGGTGCIHNHYYGYTPTQGMGTVGCDPAPVLSTSGSPRVGSICDVSPQSNGAAVAQSGVVSNPAPIISHAGAPGQMIVSQPMNMNRLNPFAWRRKETQSIAQTHVDGAYEDDTVVK